MRDLQFEIAETFSAAFQLKLEEHQDALKGAVAENYFGGGYVHDPNSEDYISDDDPLATYIHGGDFQRVQERIDLVSPFLSRLRPRSAYNESIFLSIAHACMDLAQAQSTLDGGNIDIMLSSMRSASQDLGIAKGILDCREFGKSTARSGALTLADKRKESRAHAMAVWRKEISPKLSAERAAELLRTKFHITIGHGNLARYISAEKRKLNNTGETEIEKAPSP
ncbi:hypothetical protein C2U69_03720 [Cupriavidus pinatubonensis]|nr:hypothetical protein C2U69_03720 [Cupriavidus pinatubonensis]